MGLLDGLREALGLRAESDATRRADPDDLFGLSTAYVTMSAELGYEPAGVAALCFSEVDSSQFAEARAEVERVLEVGEAETGTEATYPEDSRGYQWAVFHDPDFEDLVTSVHFAADTLVEAGFGSRLLAALFAFESDRLAGYAYWVYSFRRGTFYPFVPTGDHERAAAAEFKLETNLAANSTSSPTAPTGTPSGPTRAPTPGRSRSPLPT